MRELWLVDDAPIFGGGQRNVLNLCRFIDGSLPDRRAVVVCPAGTELAQRCQALGVTTIDATFPDLRLGKTIELVQSVVHLRQVLKRAPDGAIVVAFSLRTATYIRAAAIGLGSRLSVVPFLPEQDSAERLTARWLLPQFGAAVVIGDAAADTYRERIPRAHFEAVDNFLPAEEIAAAPRASRPPPDGRGPTIGVLARLIPEKGIGELMEELAAHRNGWRDLVVGGDAPDEAFAAALVHRGTELGLEERVRFIGRVHALGPFFADIDVLVVPSIGKEGQPTVIIEALAHGRPVIVRESVWSEAFADLPVRPYRGAEGLRAALAELRDEVVSRETLLERFTPGRAIDAIESAAAGGGPSR